MSSIERIQPEKLFTLNSNASLFLFSPQVFCENVLLKKQINKNAT